MIFRLCILLCFHFDNINEMIIINILIVRLSMFVYYPLVLDIGSASMLTGDSVLVEKMAFLLLRMISQSFGVIP